MDTQRRPQELELEQEQELVGAEKDTEALATRHEHSPLGRGRGGETAKEPTKEPVTVSRADMETLRDSALHVMAGVMRPGDLSRNSGIKVQAALAVLNRTWAVPSSPSSQAAVQVNITLNDGALAKWEQRNGTH